MGQETDKRNKLSHVVQFLGLSAMIRVVGQVGSKYIFSYTHTPRGHTPIP